MKARRPVWLLYLLFGACGGLAYYVLPPVRTSGAFFNVLGLSSVVAILLGVRLHRPAHRLPWILFAFGQALFIAGDVITYNYPALFGSDIPFPSIGDIFYLSVYPVLVAGILLLIRERHPGKNRDSLIDSLIITIGVGILSWEFLMAPYAHDHTLTNLVKLVSIAYPLMDLLLLGVVVRLSVGPSRREPSLYLLTAAAIGLLVTDAAYGMIQLSGVIYQNGGPLEAGWLSFYLLLGAAALHPSMRTVTEPMPNLAPKRPRRRLAILAVASLVSPTVNVVQAVRGSLLDPGIVSACSGAVFGLVFLRMRRLMVDITEYRKKEAELSEAEAKYRTLVESLPAVVYIAEFGASGRWLYVSPQIEAILGYSPREWTEQPELWHERVHPDDHREALDDEQRVLTTNAILQCEYRIRARDDRDVWIREEARALLSADGRPALLQGVMYDITHQKTAEQTLRRALETEQDAAQHLRELNEMKNSFLLAVSHDLRTPLTSIMGSALTLKQSELSLTTDDANSLLDIIASNSVKLNRLLTDLLDVDRLSRGAIQPNREDVDLRDLIHRVLAECELDDRPLEADVPSVVAFVDASQIERIVENLIRNACRYTPAGTPIWVRVERRGEDVLLTVEDAGPGVPDELKWAIFEPFRQGAERVSHSPGVGIGLSLVARFAELHGGQAWVEDRPGGGASFNVLLPHTAPASGFALLHAVAPPPVESTPAEGNELGRASA